MAVTVYTSEEFADDKDVHEDEHKEDNASLNSDEVSDDANEFISSSPSTVAAHA